MGLKFSVHTEGMDDVRRQLALACDKAEHVLAIQVESDTDQFVPARNRVLADGTRVIGNLVVYPGPYARYLYYGKVWIDPKINAAGFLTDEGWFSRKGSRKVPTERDLHISQAVNRKACSHWFEASKAQNLKKWVRVADKAVKDEL
jgi:hypothetical protein